MKRIEMTALKYALALAVVLAITGTGWAKKPTFAGPGTDGQLDPTRTIVTLSVPVPQQACQTSVPGVQTFLYSVKASILQPSGRILAIGLSDPTQFDCATAQIVNVTITAVQGLSFKPGPATLIYKVIETTITTVGTDPITGAPITVTTTNVINEYGSTVNLHP